jgi:hypothetical protein
MAWAKEKSATIGRAGAKTYIKAGQVVKWNKQ